MSPTPPQTADPGRVDPFVAAVVLVAAAFTLVTGIWALLAPESFSDAVDFPAHEHYLHDIGAFQIGLGVMLVLALLWPDALAVGLAAFLAGNTIHALNHWGDLDLGGRDTDPWAIAALSALAAVALWRRLAQLGFVVGRVGSTTTPALDPFVRQKTVALTTFRRDGTPVATALSLAVDGDRAVFRTYEKAGKARRLTRDPAVTVAPSRTRGAPTGPAVRGTARRLEGEEQAQAARLLRRKHPVLHGAVVPLSHRVLRRRAGRTIHFELRPADG